MVKYKDFLLRIFLGNKNEKIGCSQTSKNTWFLNWLGRQATKVVQNGWRRGYVGLMIFEGFLHMLVFCFYCLSLLIYYSVWSLFFVFFLFVFCLFRQFSLVCDKSCTSKQHKNLYIYLFLAPLPASYFNPVLDLITRTWSSWIPGFRSYTLNTSASSSSLSCSLYLSIRKCPESHPIRTCPVRARNSSILPLKIDPCPQ